MSELPPSPSLDERIASLRPQLSPKQIKLARFLLNNKLFMSFASAHQAAEKTGASPATVVRFAQSLGYEGYPQMQAALRAELPSYLRAMDRLQSRLESPETFDGLHQTVYQTDAHNLQHTARSLSESQLNAAVEAIVKARRVQVVSAGLSAAAGVYLAHSLKIIGLDAHLNTSEGLGLFADLAQITENDLVIAIDLWRYVRTTLSAAQHARQAGAVVIALTDSVVSPLAQAADYAFEASTEGVAHSLSLVGLISLVNVFIAALSYRIPEQTLRSLQHVDLAYRQNNLLYLE